MPIDSVIHTNQHSIDRVLGAGVPVVLYFLEGNNLTTDTSLDQAASTFAGRALFAKIDAAAEPTLMQRFGVQQTPSTVFVKGGETDAIVAGSLSPDDRNAWLNYLIDGGARPANSASSTANGTGTKNGGSGKPITLTDANFQQVISGPDPVLVDFWAPWCGPCRMVAPSVEQLAEEFAGRAVVGKLNVDDNYRTSQQYGIQGIPALYTFKNGQPVEQLVGAQPIHVLRQRLSMHA